MTIAPVPQDRVGLAYSGVVGGAPVRGIDWDNGVALLNWIVGNGRVLVPCFKPEHPPIPLVSGVRPGVIAYPLWYDFSRATIDWIAFAYVRSSSTIPIVGAREGQLITTPGQRRGAYALGGVGGIGVVIGPTATAYQVDMIGAYEVPRVAVETTLAMGGATGLETISGQHIKFETAWEQALTQCQRTRHGRRVLFHRSTPYAQGGVIGPGGLQTQTGFSVAVTSGTFVDVTQPVPVLARRLTASATGPCLGRAWTFHDGTAVGEVRFVGLASTGSAVTTQSAGAWTAESAVNVRCEDTSDAAGIPGAGIDFVRAQARRVSGAGTVYVAASVLYEALT